MRLGPLVGMACALFQVKSDGSYRSVIPPNHKVALGSPVRMQMLTRQFAVATNFFWLQIRRSKIGWYLFCYLATISKDSANTICLPFFKKSHRQMNCFKRKDRGKIFSDLYERITPFGGMKGRP